MRLILSGGGSKEKAKEAYEIFARELGGGKVLYIPLAWDNGNMEDCINWLRSELLPYGVTNIEDVLDAKLITKERLAQCSGVFIGGGNTFKLLKILKETQAFNNLKEFIDNNGLIMGGSAGALLFGKSIDTCLKTDLNIAYTDENYVGLKDTVGFDKLDGYSLFVHYEKKEEQKEITAKNIQMLLKSGHKLICLPEETSLWVTDDKIDVIGQKPATIFNGK